MGGRKQTAKWTTREGQHIRLCDMDDKHLLSTLKMLERYASACRARDLQGNMWFADILNGEQAIASAEENVATLTDDEFDEQKEYCPPIYWKMLNEATRRGLPT